MITFFRRIRQQLLTEKKPALSTGRYLKYAIGEIVLVMIGILLALQVNNWNELRKTNHEIAGLIKVFQSELESNILMADELIDFGYTFDSINSLLIAKKLTRNTIQEPLRLIDDHFGTNTSRFNDEHLNELIAIENQLPEKYLSIITKLKELKRMLESQKIWEDAVVDLAKQRKKEFVETLPWFYDSDSLSKEKAKDFLLNDPFYRNKVKQFTDLQLDENIWDATSLRTMSIDLLWNLKKMDPKYDIDIKAYLNSKNLVPFDTFDCDANSFNTVKQPNFRTRFVTIQNNRTELTLNFMDEQMVISQSLKIPPVSNDAEFILEDQYFGKVSFIQVIEAGKCVKIYSIVRDGFLILE